MSLQVTVSKVIKEVSGFFFVLVRLMWAAEMAYWSECILSISTDGKILIWNDPVKGLKFPIKGHLIARTKDNQI